MEKQYLTTKEVAELLDVNEKIVYQLINEKGLPACKVTGKWLFPKRDLEMWIENHVINKPAATESIIHSLIIIIGSHDLLLERVISYYNKKFDEAPIVYSLSGSLFGIKALKKGICHIASSHLLHEDEKEYNFDYLKKHFGKEPPVVVNFCYREQGIAVKKGNPKGIKDIKDFAKKDLVIANRPKGTGTRALLDHELKKAGISPSDIKGYKDEFASHIDIAIEIFSGKRDAGICIKAVTEIFGLDFIPLRWERYDLFIPKNFFFERNIQRFLSIIQDKEFIIEDRKFSGYNMEHSGRIIFPKE